MSRMAVFGIDSDHVIDIKDMHVDMVTELELNKGNYM